jgi:hypothetical protein
MLKRKQRILECFGIETYIDDNRVYANSEDDGIVDMTDWTLEEIKEWLDL